MEKADIYKLPEKIFKVEMQTTPPGCLLNRYPGGVACRFVFELLPL
jgi:hypothetical protein